MAKVELVGMFGSKASLYSGEITSEMISNLKVGDAKMDKKEELKPCPFCGSTELRIYEDWVSCADCFANGPGQDCERNARDAWNTRADTALDQIRKADFLYLKQRIANLEKQLKKEDEKMNQKSVSLMEAALEEIREERQVDLLKGDCDRSVTYISGRTFWDWLAEVKPEAVEKIKSAVGFCQFIGIMFGLFWLIFLALLGVHSLIDFLTL